MKPVCSRKKTYTIFLLFCFSATALSVHAQKTWDGGAGTNNWSDGNNWNPNGVPAATDAVTIGNGFNVILNTNATVASLTIGGGTSGSLQMGNNNTNRTLTVNGNININNGATLNTTGNGGNQISVTGNITNNGTLDMNIGGASCDVTFNGAANQTLSGTGATTDFNDITVNNSGGAGNNIVEVVSSNFSASNGFLTLTRGILKMSGSYTFANSFFNTSNPTINNDEGIWLNNSNVTVNGQNGNTQLSGYLRITAGTYNVGIGADFWLTYNTGASFIMEGGALNVSGAFAGTTTTSTITYNQSGGTITVNTAGNTMAIPSFGVEATGSSFTLSGGTIVLCRPATAYTDFINWAGTATITGGTLQAGNASTPAGALFWINSTPAVHNLVVNATNSPQTELRSNTTVSNSITISAGSTLDVAPNNVNLTLGGDWINNGTFNRGTATVTFTGGAAQQIGGSANTTFHNLTINKTAGAVTLNRPTTVSGNATFTGGIVNSSATNLLIFNDNATTSGANNGAVPSYVNGPVRKIGNDAFTFPVGKTGAGYRLCGISAPANATDAFTAEFMRSSARGLGSITAAGLYQVSNCEYWNINRTTGSSSVNVTLSWSGLSDCNAIVYVTNPASLAVAYFGTSWSSYGNSGFSGTASAGTVTWNNVSTFGPFALGSTSPMQNLLPLSALTLNISTGNGQHKLSWNNLQETGVQDYKVERSFDGTSFTDLQAVAPRSNAGDKQSYTFIDPQAGTAAAWYRIRQTSLNGEIRYSNIVRVSPKTEAGLQCYPNPVSNGPLTVQFQGLPGNYTLKCISGDGRILYNSPWIQTGTGTTSRVISLPADLPKGYYILELSDGVNRYSKPVLKH